MEDKNRSRWKIFFIIILLAMALYIGSYADVQLKELEAQNATNVETVQP